MVGNIRVWFDALNCCLAADIDFVEGGASAGTGVICPLYSVQLPVCSISGNV